MLAEQAQQNIASNGCSAIRPSRTELRISNSYDPALTALTECTLFLSQPCQSAG